MEAGKEGGRELSLPPWKEAGGNVLGSSILSRVFHILRHK